MDFLDPTVTRLVMAACVAVSVALGVFAMRRQLADMYWTHVQWLRDVMWRFSPDPYDGRLQIALIYAGYIAVIPLLVFLFGSIIVGMILWLLLLLIPNGFVSYRWYKRRQLIDEQLPQAVLQMSTSVASGMTLIQAIDRTAERAPSPVNVEFRIISNQWKHGADLVGSIDEAKRRLKLPNFTLFASAVSINQQMGGNVVVTLERLAQSLQQMQEMAREVYAATSEGRTNIKVLAITPAVMLVLVGFIDAGGVIKLFTDPYGRAMLGVAAVMTLAGAAWAWKIINADI